MTETTQPQAAPKKLSRASRRAAEKLARKDKGRGRSKQHHLSRDQLLRRDGLGQWTKFVPLTEKDLNYLSLLDFSNFTRCVTGDAAPDDPSWDTVIAALLQGKTLSTATEQAAQLGPLFTRAVNLFIGFQQMKALGEELPEDDVQFVRERLLEIDQMRQVFTRDELIRALDFMHAHIDEMCDGITAEARAQLKERLDRVEKQVPDPKTSAAQ